jgi:hypothetical protein
MKLRLELENPFWWFWAVTLAFIGTAVVGWIPGYYVVMAVSALQVVVFLVRERSVMAFPTQVRIVYFAATLIGLWEPVRLPFYVLLLLATAMVVFLGRCSIALVLKHVPWNRDRAPRMQ